MTRPVSKIVPINDRRTPVPTASRPASDQPAPPLFRLTLLGRFNVVGPQGAVDLGSKKLCGLLAFLASQAGQPQPREKLMTLFWGSHFEPQARQNLRKALSRLRAALGDILVSDDERVSLAPGSVASDFEQFETLLREASHAALAEAAGLYRDSFLCDVAIREEGWSEWLGAERRRLEALAINALVRLAQQELEAGNASAAVEAGNRALGIDNLREDAHRMVIAGLAADGRRTEALRHYERLVDLLRRELDVKPDAATTMLIADIRGLPPNTAASSPGGDAPGRQLALPDRPSIAVLPFDNMSSDPQRDYFADGVVEDIITALSRVRWLLVIARNSTFTYKGQPIDIRRVGRELGVRYVVEGSVRAAADRVRITAQLIEAESGAHIWAQRYDRALDDIFALQDEIAEAIVAAVEPSIRSAEIERVKAKPTESLDAYDLYLRALPELYALTESSCLRAEALLRRAVTLDPNYSEALAALVDCIARQWLNGWIPAAALESAKDEAVVLGRRAVAADPQNGTALAAAAYACAVIRPRFDQGLELAARAAEAHPNSAYVHNLCGHVCSHSGEIDRALAHFAKARRLDPLDPRGYHTLAGMSLAHFFGRRFAEAAKWAAQAVAEGPSWAGARRYHAAALAQLGRLDEAGAEVKELLKLQPNSSLTRSRTSSFRYDWMLDLYIGALHRAGLPEN